MASRAQPPRVARMRSLGQMRSAAKTVWECVRTVTGDNAYDRYLQHHEQTHPGTPPLSRRGVYDEAVGQKGGGGEPGWLGVGPAPADPWGGLRASRLAGIELRSPQP